MSSLVPGFEYDVFISYRRKDNKGERWVSDFVSSLKTELESTFKEDISVYFDENPGDGLLEMHSVDKSLEGKLNCLVFIPILSRTYCDTTSFAWQHEFLAFNKLAKEDEFGRDIKLRNGNVISRILPVKIHDLDTSDQKMFEAEVGGQLRCVDFIFQTPGVNRALTQYDKRTENDSHIFYRDQVNKVAIAIKDIVVSMRKVESEISVGSNDTNKILTKNRKFFAVTAGAVLTLVILFYLNRDLFSSDLISDKSIVVLPFTDLSKEHDLEYFGDGMMEEILNHLARIGDLRVISRTSAMKYKGAKKSLGEIASELGVTSVLEGSVRTAGDQIRITVKLIDVANERQLWSKDYDYRDMKDIFAIHRDVSTKVANELKAKLTSAEKRSLAQAATQNPEAYKLYLKGRYFWSIRTNESYDSAERYYRRAIELDPQYALAYSGLADCYTLGQQGMTNKDESEIAKVYIKKALSLDSGLCEALTTAGFIQSHFEHNWDEGRETLRKALQINPNYPVAHLYLGNIYIFTGTNIDQGLREVKQAFDFDPLSPSVNWALGNRYYVAQLYDQAVRQFEKTMVIDPNNRLAEIWMILSLIRNGKYDRAHEALNRLPEKLPHRKILTALISASQGDATRARQELEQILKEITPQSRPFELYFVTLLHVKLGNYDEAVELFEQLYEARDLNVMGLKVDKNLDPLRNHPRFQAIIRKMNF